MAKLPLSPGKFLLVILSLAAFPAVAQTFGFFLDSYVTLSAPLIASILYLRWIFVSLKFVEAVSLRRNLTIEAVSSANISRFKLFLSITLLLLCVIIATDSFFGPYISENSSILVSRGLAPLVGFLFFGFLMAVFWLPARTLCDTEARVKVPWYQVVGTFFLYVYLAVGVFFIFKRLQKLESENFVSAG